MSSVHIKEIVTAIPSAVTIALPNDWFECLSDDVSIFETLYRWMVAKRGVSPNRLHNRTYAGASVARRLLSAERRRIGRRRQVRGPELDRALSFSDMDAGPQTLFAERRVLGDALVVISEEDDDRVNCQMKTMREKQRNTKNRKICEIASGADFGQWLISNLGRDEPIGDLARDIDGDSDFPRAASHFQELVSYTEQRGACAGALDALAEAWMEYCKKYPERITRAAWCALCKNEIVGFEGGILAWPDDGGGLQVLHRECLGEPDAPALNMADLAGDDVWESLAAFADQFEIPSSLVADTERLLRLWGFNSCRDSRKGVVYFVQVGTSGSIKIGYTAGPTEKRLAQLQTANPQPLRLLAEFDGDRDIEAGLHRRFSAHRASGEWFDPHPEIIDFIALLRRGTAP
jgi:uncharacterized protein YozE (UPF0346 family)